MFWKARSFKDLEKVTRFNATLFGFPKAIEIALAIRKYNEVLENDNCAAIGAVDEAFSHLKREYRKLIHHHCKITYREGTTKFI